MKLLSPVNSFESAKAQVENGADEIYLGLKTDLYKRFSFSGRGQSSKEYESITPDQNELEKIVELSHAKGVEVSLAANIPIFAEALYGDFDMEKEFLKNVYAGIECGIDNIIIGDIGLLYKLGRMNLPVKIHASSFFDTMSIDQLLFLKSLGASRCVLTYHAHMDEIEKLCRANIMEIEVFCYLSCSFLNGSCNMVHDRGEVSKGEDLLFGIPCKSRYNISGQGIEETDYQFFDAELGCSLCSLKTLKGLGVDVVKIAGRDRDYEMTAQVTGLFRKFMDAIDELNEEEYLRFSAESTPIWWKRLWCKNNRCKYRSNRITDSYVGVNPGLLKLG